MKHPTKLLVVAVAIALSASIPTTTMAQDDVTLEEVITVGTRSSKPRSAADSTVPIDVISGDEFNALGSTADLTDNLKAVVPSYTATPATGDGSAFIRPTSLRGTAADQTLVLVNGKRRHRSALVQFLAPATGRGAHGVDIGMIPGIAVKSVEVLRDGAASQYGSDAIAGVINFVMKDASEGGQVQVQYGEYYDSEDSAKFSANAGLGLGDNGFANVSFEYIDNTALSRGIQRSVAQDLINAGVQGVGQDAPFGDAPFVQTWGRPETSGARFFVNSGFDVSDTAELYARLGYADTEGRYRFFFRHPDTHAVFASQRAFGDGCPVCDPDPASDPMNLIPDTMSLREQGFVGLPAGFTPFLDGDQTDISLSMGLNGEFQSGMLYDFSFGFGKNELEYFLNNTANQSLGPGDLMTLPQMDFDVGGYEEKELGVNADFSLPISDTLNLGIGAEWREETFTVVSGEPTSYLGAGASGLKGVAPEDGGAFARDNVAVYADLEHDISDALLVQYALRLEDFSDFGSTINGKIAGRYRFSDAFAIRGAVSTGFHAPTPGQANVRTTITTADSVSGMLVEEGLFPPTDPAAVAVGGTPLTEEESLNLSLGFTADILDNTTLTLDVYRIEVDGRIYRTGNIVDNVNVGNTISYFTNAMDVEHTGLDLVLTSGWNWSGNTNTDLTLAVSYTDVDVVSRKAIPVPDGMGGFNQVLPVGDNDVFYIENNFPNERAVLTANTFFGDRLNFMIRANYYGSHFDERGSVTGSPEVDNAGVPTGFCCVDKTFEIDATVFVDVELGFQINDNWQVNLGAINIFDEFVDTVPNTSPTGCISCNAPEFNNREGVGLTYPRRSAANYEGGSWYLRGIFSFD